MLIKFTVKNFRSFKDEVSLDMNKLLVNSKNNHGKNHINKSTIGGFETLKAATIYGANASGKTNLIKAISLLTKWASGKANYSSERIFSEDVNISDKFLLDEKGLKSKPSYFSIEFNTSKKAYRYEIAILNGSIVKESLEEICLEGSLLKEDIIFSREYDNKEESYKSVKIGKQYTDNIDLSQIESAIQISESNKPMLQQLLKYNFSQKIKESSFFSDIKDAINWLRNDNLYYEQTKSNMESFELTAIDDGFRKFLLRLIKKYDLGPIYDISIEKLSNKEQENLFAKIAFFKDNALKLSDSETAFAVIGQERYLIKKEGLSVTIKSIKLVRKNNSNNNIYFGFARESQGTVKLIDLAMFFYKGFNQNKTIVIDEIESSFHPRIVMDLLKDVLNDEEIANVQFIVTTHSECLFDLKIFRGDEIWLMNKRNDGSSYINCLADFKKNNKSIRADKIILNDYLLGRYGGVPRI